MCMKHKIIYEFSKKIGQRIKIERIKKEIKQDELASMANLGRSTMGLIERGESSPTLETVKQIADALEIEIYKLFIFD